MAKYNIEFKLKVVLEYLNGGIGLRPLADKYGIKGAVQIRKWIKIYNVQGIRGLEPKTTTKSYSSNFKLTVLQYMKTNNATLAKIGLLFEIPDYSLISAWDKKFSEGGIGALSKPKGRPSIHMTNTKKPNKPKENEGKSKLELLEKEILLLRIENEYLKKLHARGLELKAKESKNRPK